MEPLKEGDTVQYVGQDGAKAYLEDWPLEIYDISADGEEITCFIRFKRSELRLDKPLKTSV